MHYGSGGTMDYPNFSDSGIQLPIRPQAIAFDLDGTLLDYDGRLSEPVARAVKLIARGGIAVFLITGRMEIGCEKFWRELCLDTPMATCNGAYIGYPGKDPIYHERLSAQARDAILDVEKRHGLYVNYYIDNHVYTLHDTPEREYYSRFFYHVELARDREDITHRRPPTKCLCVSSEEDQPRIAELFEEALAGEAGVTRSSPKFTEMLPKNIDKGVGLRRLAELSGIPVESFVAVGDAMNDLPMLQTAGFAITFKSGDPKLVEHVDMLLPPLWEDGMDVLAKCILGMTNSGRFLTARSQRFFKK